MISGTCLTLSNLAHSVKIYAAEPEQADDAYRSFKAGHIIADDALETIADGLKVPLKDLTWHFVSNHVTDILIATEEDIVDAMRLVWKRMKIVMEPSSAVPFPSSDNWRCVPWAHLRLFKNRKPDIHCSRKRNRSAHRPPRQL